MSHVRRLAKLLVANRGEIALRIFRTAKRMGLRTVAVYSDADRDAMHVGLADEAVRIGPPPAKDSYLRIEAIIDAAHRTGAQAIHPGYGFLAENADFAEACAAADLVFVGPSAETIRLMGSKAAAKKLMEAAGVPVVPGYHDDDQSLATLRGAAERIGYPVLVKASSGGGGRGMRLVAAADELEQAVASAKREAAAAFDDDRILLEKYISRSRHIEVQVFGDRHGGVVSLFERECTLQRRHQKVVEEAPAVDLTAPMRAEMAAAACAAAKAANYVNAGTVEFIADGTSFHFIEMNTRLQVEHPVTEMITGLDLVEWQLRVAAGEPLPLRQEEIQARGHAIEARIYAEDAEKGFLPSIGRISRWREPKAVDGIRIDAGFHAGDTITPHYDALLAKLIAFGGDRQQALDRMAAALSEFEITGVTTNLEFIAALVAHPQVRSGAIDTGFVERELPVLTGTGRLLTARDLAAASAAVLLRERDEHETAADGSPWSRTDGWMMAGRRRRRMRFRLGQQQHEAVVSYGRSGMTMERGAQDEPFAFVPREGGIEVVLGGSAETVSAAWNGHDLALITPRGRLRLHWLDPFHVEAGQIDHVSRIVAPMAGTVARILAEPGSDVPRGTPLIVVEAMKMEHTLRAPVDGHLKALRCAVGDVVQEGAELADFEPRRVDADV